MAKGLSPSEVAAKWRQNLSNAGPTYKAGVQSVTIAPTQAAKKQADKMVRRLKESVDSGRYAEGCDSVTLPDWQSACIDQGAARLVDGAAHGESNTLRYLEVALPVIHRLAAEVRAMPNSTDAEIEARMLAFRRSMKKFKYSRRRGK